MALKRVRVWDLPTRAFHWALVSMSLFAWGSAELGELAWHRRAGLAILGLLVFRLYWGFAGSSTARFHHFIRGPRAVIVYARRLHLRNPAYHIGHNPLSGLGAVALLALLALQVALGLFAVDVDGLESGPLSHWVSFDVGRLAAETHEIVFGALAMLVTLHVSAIAFYAFYKRDNLLEAMLRGDRCVPETRTPAHLAPHWRVLPGLLLAGAAIWLIATVLGSA